MSKRPVDVWRFEILTPSGKIRATCGRPLDEAVSPKVSGLQDPTIALHDIVRDFLSSMSIHLFCLYSDIFDHLLA